MPENQTPPTGQHWERRLRSGLRELEADAPGGGLPGPDLARRTHGRRRAVLVAGSALATVVLVGGTVLALDGPSTSAPVAPTTTEPAPSATTDPSPSSPSPTAPPTTAAPPPTTAPATTEAPRAVPTTIPEDFRLPGEDAVADDPWVLVDRLDIGCGPQEVDTSGAGDSRVARQDGPEYSNTEALVVHADVEAALAMVDSARALAGCGDGGTVTTVTPVAGPWGEAVVIVFTPHPELAEMGDRGAAYWLLARTGTAVAVVGAQGELTSEAHPDPDPQTLASLQDRIAPIAAVLCAYTEAGC